MFYGAGEVAETILAVTNKREKKRPKILALIDDQEMSKNKELLGHKIIARDEIEEYNHDGIVITSYVFEDKIKKLEEIDYPTGRTELFFNKI